MKLIKYSQSHLGCHFRKLKAQARTSLLPRFSEKRSSSSGFDLWARNSIRKCHPKWDRLTFLDPLSIIEVQPIPLGVTFSNAVSKLKVSGKRDLRALSFELSKMSPQGYFYFHHLTYSKIHPNKLLLWQKSCKWHCHHTICENCTKQQVYSTSCGAFILYWIRVVFSCSIVL